MRPWKDSQGLLDLFSIPRTKWSDRFVDLVEMGALVIKYTEYSVGDLVRGFLKEQRLSPLIYWTNMKKAVRPLFEAGGETLRALGVPVEGEPQTTMELAVAVALAMAADLGEDGREMARQIADRLAELEGGGKRG